MSLCSSIRSVLVQESVKAGDEETDAERACLIELIVLFVGEYQSLKMLSFATCRS